MTGRLIRPRKVPSTGRSLLRGLLGRCPACGQRGQVRRLVQVQSSCRRCGLEFERIEGHFIGAVGMNTIMSLGVLVISLLGGLIITYPEPPVLELVLINAAVAIVAPLLLFAPSRMLWTGIDIAMRPLNPDEVDWGVVLECNGEAGGSRPGARHDPDRGHEPPAAPPQDSEGTHGTS